MSYRASASVLTSAMLPREAPLISRVRGNRPDEGQPVTKQRSEEGRMAIIMRGVYYVWGDF